MYKWDGITDIGFKENQTGAAKENVAVFETTLS